MCDFMLLSHYLRIRRFADQTTDHFVSRKGSLSRNLKCTKQQGGLVRPPGKKSQEESVHLGSCNVPRTRTLADHLFVCQRFSPLVLERVYSIYIRISASDVESSFIGPVQSGLSLGTVCGQKLLSELSYYIHQLSFLPL